MSRLTDKRVAEFYAQTYDQAVPDWPGEIDFYRALASETKLKGQGLLELACGTGRVLLRLAADGVRAVGLDLSPEILAVARAKSEGLAGVEWVQADMSAFDLGETFGLVLITGHAFQHLNTPLEQAACLQCAYRHLEPGGRLVIHVDKPDFLWLGDLLRDKGGVFEPAGQFVDPRTGYQVRDMSAWSFEPCTQTAITITTWEATAAGGEVVDRWQTQPVRLHVVFRFEMEHLLAREGFALENLDGDFFRHSLDDQSAGMIFVAARPQGG